MPPEARIGTWVFEWYWNQPNVPHVTDFVAAIRKINNGKVPTARHWFGYVSVWTCALVANQNKTLDAVKLAKALENFTLPPEVALMPDKVFYRAGDHQLMPDLYVGHAVEKAPNRKTSSTSTWSRRASMWLLPSRRPAATSNGLHRASRIL